MKIRQIFQKTTSVTLMASALLFNAQLNAKELTILVDASKSNPMLTDGAFN